MSLAEVAKPEIREYNAEQQLRIDNYKLKVQNARLLAALNDANLRIQNFQLQQEKQILDSEFGNDWLNK